MLFKAVITKELELPYFAVNGCSYFRINSNKSLLRIDIVEGADQKIHHASVAVSNQPNDHDLAQIFGGMEVKPDVVDDAKDRALEYMDTVLKNQLQPV